MYHESIGDELDLPGAGLGGLATEVLIPALQEESHMFEGQPPQVPQLCGIEAVGARRPRHRKGHREYILNIPRQLARRGTGRFSTGG